MGSMARSFSLSTLKSVVSSTGAYDSTNCCISLFLLSPLSLLPQQLPKITAEIVAKEINNFFIFNYVLCNKFVVIIRQIYTSFLNYQRRARKKHSLSCNISKIYVPLQTQNKEINMDKKTLSKLYLSLSWLLLVATCVLAFVMKNANLSMFGLILSIAFRYLAERAECALLKKENQELKDDMKRLTKLLEDLTKNKE